MATFATWAGIQSTSLATSLNSDAVALSPATSVSVDVTVTGSGASGISGSFKLQGSNGGSWADIPGSLQAVLVGSGMQAVITVEATDVGYESVRLAWTVGSHTGGAASGVWDISNAPPAKPTPLGSSSGITQSAQAGVDFMGRDWSVSPDLTWRVVTGFQNLGEALVRRLSTPRGGLFYDPNYGTDLQEWVNRGVQASDIPRLCGLISQECEKDDRVYSAAATIDTAVLGGGFNVSIAIVTIAGPFTLDLAVSKAGVALLEAA